MKGGRAFTDENAKWLKPKARQAHEASEEEEEELAGSSEEEEAQQEQKKKGEDGAGWSAAPLASIPACRCSRRPGRMARNAPAATAPGYMRRSASSQPAVSF